MDLQNIQEQLNAEFSKQGTRLIFWFDDKGDYADEVSDLELVGASLHVLDGSNWLKSKWLLDEDKPNEKFLVYAAFSKPSDEENPLADMCYYSYAYYTDRISQMSQEIGIDSRFKEHLAQYGKFWKNVKRIEGFKALGIDHYNTETIDIGLIAVLTEVKTPNFEEVIKKLILSDSGVYIKAIENNGLSESFWKLCGKYFGYESEKPSINDLAACMLVTYSAATLKTSVPASLSRFTLKKRNDVVVLIRNIMNNVQLQESYNALAERIDKGLRLTHKIEEELKKDNSAVQMSDLIHCDTFKGFDDIIIRWILDKLDAELLDAQIADMSIEAVVALRISRAFHFSEMYRDKYTALKYAYKIMRTVSHMDFGGTVSELVKRYQDELYLVDSYYRWFYYAYDRVEESEDFCSIRQKVENIYANDYLAKCVPKWNELYDENSVTETGLIRQQNFYQHYLRAYDGKERVIVIISDALRFECAKELMEKFEMDEKCDARMEAMLGVLPSVTSVGMASLLPNIDVQVSEGMEVRVDGFPCDSLAARDKILKAKNSDNIAVAFETIAQAGKAAVRELLQGKNIVYIYHNQVDARGDKSASENEVFNACEEAIGEILRLIHKLTEGISATKYIITADHGFLYRRDKLKASDKIPIPKDVCAYENKRFLITREKVSGQGFLSRALAYLSKINEAYVTTPIGADIFSASGAGQNYVHGGSSLQEMIIPVVEVKTFKGKLKTDFVDVILTSVFRRVTNLITFFDFIQTEKVTDVMKGRNIVAFFTDGVGEKISFDVPIMANSREDAPEKRIFHEKFTLKSREYKYGEKYYLNLAEAGNEKNVLHSYEFMIDIAFVDDFGF